MFKLLVVLFINTTCSHTNLTLILSLMKQLLEKFHFEFPHVLQFSCTWNKEAAIIFIILWDFLMFYQIFLSPQVKRCTIITYKHSTYELPNDLRLRILGADYMEIFIPGWNFNLVYRVEKNCNYMKNFNPVWKYFNSGWNTVVALKK